MSSSTSFPKPAASMYINLPYDIHFLILSHLNIPTLMVLCVVHPTLRSSIDLPTRISSIRPCIRLRQLNEAAALDPFFFAKRVFACRICLRLRPIRFFHVLDDRRMSGRRFCIDCGIDHNLFPPGKRIDTMDSFGLRCEDCWEFIPSDEAKDSPGHICLTCSLARDEIHSQCIFQARLGRLARLQTLVWESSFPNRHELEISMEELRERLDQCKARYHDLRLLHRNEIRNDILRRIACARLYTEIWRNQKFWTHDSEYFNAGEEKATHKEKLMYLYWHTDNNVYDFSSGRIESTEITPHRPYKIFRDQIYEYTYERHFHPKLKVHENLDEEFGKLRHRLSSLDQWYNSLDCKEIQDLMDPKDVPTGIEDPYSAPNYWQREIYRKMGPSMFRSPGQSPTRRQEVQWKCAVKNPESAAAKTVSWNGD